MRAPFPTDAELEALEAIQFGSYQAADDARTTLARLVAARERAAAVRTKESSLRLVAVWLRDLGHDDLADVLHTRADELKEGEDRG